MHELPSSFVSPDGAGLLPLTDGALVERVGAGDLAAFELLMRRHNQRVYRTVRAVLGDDDEVEDAMQQVYVNAFQHLGRFEHRASVSTWLTRIALNEAFARLRRRHRREDLTIADETGIEQARSPGPTPEEVAARLESRVFLERAVDALPSSLRVVFVLRAIEGLDTAETSASLGLSEEAVRARFHRARRALQAWLADQVDRGVDEAFRFFRPRCDRVVVSVLESVGR